MIALTLLRASLVLAGLLSPPAFAAPTATGNVRTPFGERPAYNVHVVPEGMLSSLIRARRNQN